MQKRTQRYKRDERRQVACIRHAADQPTELQPLILPRGFIAVFFIYIVRFSSRH
jgi:hypothetical protein